MQLLVLLVLVPMRLPPPLSLVPLVPELLPLLELVLVLALVLMLLSLRRQATAGGIAAPIAAPIVATTHSRSLEQVASAPAPLCWGC